MTTRSLETVGGSGRYGAWRAVAATPVMLGSLAVVVLFGGALGRWAAVAPLTWLALALVWLTPAGERVAVRLAYRYRRPGAAARTVLAPSLEVALTRCGLAATSFDLYVRSGAEAVNAYAAGRRSAAVSAGLIVSLERGELTADQGGALLTHELGHLRTGAVRYGLALVWLSAPWRAVVAVFGGLVRWIVGKVPTGRAALLLLGPIVLVATGVQGVKQHAWLALAVLVVVALALAVQPLVDAALSRAGERAADAYAIAHGAGPDLAAALSSRSGGPAGGDWRDTHPARADRLVTLAAAGS